MADTNLDIDLSSYDLVLGADFSPITEGDHEATVTAVDFRRSRAGNPMFVFEWTITGDEDPDAGKTTNDYCVLFFKRNGKDTLNGVLRAYFAAVGLWPTSVSERAALFSGPALNDTVSKLLAEIEGCAGGIRITHEEGDIRTDSLGQAIKNADGSDAHYTNVRVAVQDIRPKKKRTRKIV